MCNEGKLRFERVLCKWDSVNVTRMSDSREIVLCPGDVSLIRAKLTRQLERLSLFNCIAAAVEEFDTLTVYNKMFFINSPSPFCWHGKCWYTRSIYSNYFITFDSIRIRILSEISSRYHGSNCIPSRFVAVVRTRVIRIETWEGIEEDCTLCELL